MKVERLLKLSDYIKENNFCSLDHLCDTFEVSKTTIRRDIETLKSMKKIKKVYGGVQYIHSEPLSTIEFSAREKKNLEKKILIARLANDFIHDGDTIFIDSGTTTLQLVKFIRDKTVNVITNSLSVATACAKYENITLIICGGSYSSVTNSFIGDAALQTLQLYNIQKAFLAATGVSLESGITNSLPLETPIKKMAISRSAEAFVLIDSDKWGEASIKTYSDFSDITAVVSDKRPPAELSRHIETAGARLIIG